MTDGILYSESVLGAIVGTVIVLVALALLLAAAAIRLRLRNKRRARIWAEREARWTLPLLRVLGGEAAPAGLHDVVSPGEERAFVGFLSRYAQRLKGVEKEIVEALAQPWLPHILPDLERRSPERRARVMQTVAELNLPGHEEILAAGLDDASPLVKMVAARRLFEPGNENYFPAVLDNLDAFDLWNRRFVATLLARGGPGAVPSLREIVRDPHREVTSRIAALEALTILHDLPAAALAEELLGEDTPPELCGAALRHLEQTGVPSQAEPVRRLLTHSAPFIRALAADVLGALGDGTVDGPRVALLLDDASPWVRISAARALDLLGAQALLETAASSPGPARDAALEMLDR